MTDADVPRFAKKARLKHDRIENRWMILYPERGLALNEEAAAIARRIDGTKTMGAIALELERELGAPREDVFAFVQSLVDKRIVELGS